MASPALLLMVMAACVTVHAVTKHTQLESWNYNYYARNWAHLGSVTAMKLVKLHNASPPPDCRANATFGFYGSTTWVSEGCRGDFELDIDDIDSSTQPCPNNFFYDALYDLESLTVCPSPHVTEYKPITTPSTDCKCCARGTLNISLSASASRRGVLVDLWFNDPSTWAFNLGDSKSNNGWKGDSGHSSYDAEIHNTNANSFIIYRNDQFNAVPAADKYHKVDNSFSRRLSLVVQDGAVQWVSDVALGQLVDVGLFGLDGQYDAEAGGPADYNLYLGLNQVVNGGRKGRGLCKAGIRFLCEDKENQTTKTTTTTTRRPKPTWKPVRKIPQRFSAFRDLSHLG